MALRKYSSGKNRDGEKRDFAITHLDLVDRVKSAPRVTTEKPPMPFTAYLPSSFQHNHENELFEKVVESLTRRCSQSPEQHVLVGNVMFEGHEMDGVFFKPDAICIVEMKNHGGQVHFSENTQWFAGAHEVRGGNHPNPFQAGRDN